MVPDQGKDDGKSTVDTTSTDYAPPDVKPGTLLGHYRVVSLLGEGGFGAVYKARDERLDRDVALKFLRQPEIGRHLKLFEREAKAIAALSKHPGIVQIHTWSTHGDQCYFVLEFVDNNADRLVRESPQGLDVALALQIAAQCANGLAFAHQKGFLHLDIKPANLLIESANGRVKIADFGLTRLLDSPSVSMLGTVSGSPPYMSPEQARGDPLDERSDVFSLGATLYELLTGAKPFAGKTTEEVLGNVRANRRVPLSEKRKDLPQAVLDIVEKAMAPNMADRFQTAGDMAAQLRTALAPLDPGGSFTTMLATADAKRPRIKRLAFRLGIAAAALVLAIGAAAIWQGRPGTLGGSNAALVEAATRMEQGDCEAAAAGYAEYLVQYPNDSDAHYGMGYALLLQGDVKGARAEFGKIGEAPLRTEGEAAAAFEEQGEAARASIEAAVSPSKTAYPIVLLASLDVGAEQYQAAVDRLAEKVDGSFKFDWQRARGIQTLGQAYYRLNKYAEAKQVLDKLKTDGGTQSSRISEAYIELAQRQLDEEGRQETREQIKRIQDARDANKADSTEDIWSSRPIRLWIVRATAGKSRAAAESGLADVLPWMLSDYLTRSSDSGITVVDRELLPEMLSEQELSGQLGSDSGRLNLGHVLGARVVLECKFDALMQEEFVFVTAADTETTMRISVPQIDLPRHFDPDTWIKELGAAITGSVQEAYPIRGRLTIGKDGPQLDIGSSVGVGEGMRFLVSPKPDPKMTLPDKRVAVAGAVGETSVSVRLDGFAASDIPSEGWYAFAEKPGAG